MPGFGIDIAPRVSTISSESWQQIHLVEAKPPGVYRVRLRVQVTPASKGGFRLMHRGAGTEVATVLLDQPSNEGESLWSAPVELGEMPDGWLGLQGRAAPGASVLLLTARVLFDPGIEAAAVVRSVWERLDDDW